MEDIPEDCLRILFGYFSYDEIGKLRMVCKRFNSFGGQTLNEGFKKAKLFHSHCAKEIKESLPRRDSERRKHRLYPRHEMLQAIETRFSLLSMTYNRMISEGLICFIPGMVLDELFKVLRIVQNHKTEISNHVLLLQEMRDISSMAMEHFDEHILPALEAKDRSGNSNGSLFSTSGLPGTSSNSLASPSGSSEVVRKSHHLRVISKLHERISSQGKLIGQLRKKTKHLENVTTSLSLTANELVKQVTVLQGLHGVQSSSLSNINPGTSGDFNNNLPVSETVRTAEKRLLEGNEMMHVASCGKKMKR